MNLNAEIVISDWHFNQKKNLKIIKTNFVLIITMYLNLMQGSLGWKDLIQLMLNTELQILKIFWKENQIWNSLYLTMNNNSFLTMIDIIKFKKAIEISLKTMFQIHIQLTLKIKLITTKIINKLSICIKIKLNRIWLNYWEIFKEKKKLNSELKLKKRK